MSSKHVPNSLEGNRDVFLLSRRWEHHARHSGYDTLADYVGAQISVKGLPNWLLPDRVLWRLARGVVAYDRTAVALEVSAARHMAAHTGCLYHILYGESSYKYLGYLNGWRGHRVIATFHMPPAAYAEIMQTAEPIKRLSGVIVLGSSQYSIFEHILPHDRIFFVPYAVDTSFFEPPDKLAERETNLVLFVGHHLRDFAALRSIIQGAYLVAPQLKFIVVTLPYCYPQFDTLHGNFALCNNIAENELLALYQRAALGVMPLVDAVANTALLEAMSCGLPTVVTDVGSVRDYADEASACFVPAGDPAAMLHAIRDLMQSPEKRAQMSMRARERALTFDWSVAAFKMRKVYDQILTSV